MKSDVFKMVLPVFSIVLLLAMAGTAVKGEEVLPTEPDTAMTGQETMTPTGSGPTTGEEVSWHVISSGGTDGSSAGMRLCGTAGQTAVGGGSSGSFSLSHGFWAGFEAQFSCTPGDADGSGGIDIDDAVYLINYIFQGGPSPVPYAVASGDAACDCLVDIDDVVYLVAYIFQGGPAPCSCQEWVAACGSPE